LKVLEGINLTIVDGELVSLVGPNGAGKTTLMRCVSDGRERSSGLVRVSVSAGNKEAQGDGRLSRASGGGTWRGQGSVGSCAGSWVAERRQ
jgi:ABC-type branched-subunit amino acid transport system ATPase component